MVFYKKIREEKDNKMNKLIIRKKLENMIGQDVEVFIDRPIGSTHPNYNNIIYVFLLLISF